MLMNISSYFACREPDLSRCSPGFLKAFQSFSLDVGQPDVDPALWVLYICFLALAVSPRHDCFEQETNHWMTLEWASLILWCSVKDQSHVVCFDLSAGCSLCFYTALTIIFGYSLIEWAPSESLQIHMGNILKTETQLWGGDMLAFTIPVSHEMLKLQNHKVTLCSE